MNEDLGVLLGYNVGLQVLLSMVKNNTGFILKRSVQKQNNNIVDSARKIFILLYRKLYRNDVAS